MMKGKRMFPTRHAAVAVQATMPRSSVSAILLLILLAASTAHPQTAGPKPTAAKDPRLSRDTPEGTLRIFMLGVMLGNEQLLKATMVPVSDPDMAYLTRKPKDAPATPKELKEQCARMKVRSLKPGDVFTLPGGKNLTVAAADVTDESMILVLADNPIPTRLYKAKGFWWVDATPVIAGRKAAAKYSAGERKAPPNDSPAGTPPGAAPAPPGT